MATLEELLAGINPADLGEAAAQRGTIQMEEISKRYKLGRAEIKGAYERAQLESKDRRAATAATREYQRGLLSQARAEMEQLGIPRLLLDRFVAEKQVEIAVGELAYKNAGLEEGRRQFDRTFGEQARQFEVQTGEGRRQFDVTTEEGRRQFNQQFGEQGRQFDVTTEEGRRQFGASLGQRESEFGRTYGLNVAQFGAQLASTPDTYYQGRRFAAIDAPRLLGQDTSTAQVYGGPTPQISTLGARLAGNDPAQVAAPGAGAESDRVYAGGSAGFVENDAERAKQVAAIAKASPPSPYDGLDAQDTASLKLMEEVYKKGGRAVPGAELARLAATGRIGYMRSAGKLLGYDPAELEAEHNAYRPVQAGGNLA